MTRDGYKARSRSFSVGTALSPLLGWAEGVDKDAVTAAILGTAIVGDAGCGSECGSTDGVERPGLDTPLNNGVIVGRAAGGWV